MQCGDNAEPGHAAPEESAQAVEAMKNLHTPYPATRSSGRRKKGVFTRQRENILEKIVSNSRCVLWDARVWQRGPKDFEWQMWVHPSQLLREFGLVFSPNESPAWMWGRSLADVSDAGYARLARIYEVLLLSEVETFQHQLRIFGPTGEIHCLAENLQIIKANDEGWDIVAVATDVTRWARRLRKAASKNRPSPDA